MTGAHFFGLLAGVDLIFAYFDPSGISLLCAGICVITAVLWSST